MEFQEYPKLLYIDGDINKAYKIATDSEHEASLSEEGFIAMRPMSDSKESLIEKAESLGIKVDARWGEARLIAEIEKAS